MKHLIFFFYNFYKLKNFIRKYISYINLFVSSYIFYSVLTGLGIILNLYFLFGSNFLFSFFYNIGAILFAIHGLYGLMHVIEDYVFDRFSRYLSISLCGLLLFKYALIYFLYMPWGL